MVEEMTPERAAQFLRDMATHLESEAARSKEDIVFWAHKGNAETCSKIADMLSSPSPDGEVGEDVVRVVLAARLVVDGAWESYSHDGQVYCVPADAFEALSAALSPAPPEG